MSRIARRNVVPVNQVTPLTYRDGVTYIQMLNELSEYVKSILHPSLQHTVDQLVSDVEQQMDKHHDQYVDGVQEFQRIHDAFMADVNAHLMALNDSAVSDLVEDTGSLLGQILHRIFATKDELHITTEPVVRTVGVNGDYATINDGLADLSQLKRLYRPHGVGVELRLLSGFVMSEQVVLDKQDLGWITITSEDTVVTIDRSAITDHKDWSGIAAFTAVNHSVLPYIDVLFEYDTSGSDLDQSGVLLYHRSSAVFGHGAGVTRSPRRGINVQQGSYASLFRANFSYSGDIGIRVANGSLVNAEEAVASYCGTSGMVLSSGAFGMANRATLTHNNGAGATAANASNLSVEGADLTNNQFGVYARVAATIDAGNSDMSSCERGIWTRQGAVVNANNADLSDCKYGVYAVDGSTVNVDNSDGNDSDYFVLSDASTVNASGAEANNCLSSVLFARGGGTVTATGLVGRNCRGNAVFAQNGGHIVANNADVSGAHGNGLLASYGSKIVSRNSTVRKGSSDNTTDMVCLSGSTLAVHGTPGGFSNSITANEHGEHGVIYQ